MSETRVRSHYETEYLEAVELFKANEFDRCIAAAQHNLLDPTLSRYHRMKNLILAASAERDWYRGERFRRQAEYLWYVTNRLCLETDEGSQTALRELREDLDELQTYQEEDAPSEIDEELLYPSDDEDDMEIDARIREAYEEEYWEDPDELEEAETGLFEDPDELARAEEQLFEDPEELARAEAELFAPEANPIALMHASMTAEAAGQPFEGVQDHEAAAGLPGSVELGQSIMDIDDSHETATSFAPPLIPPPQPKQTPSTGVQVASTLLQPGLLSETVPESVGVGIQAAGGTEAVRQETITVPVITGTAAGAESAETQQNLAAASSTSAASEENLRVPHYMTPTRSSSIRRGKGSRGRK